MFVFAKKPRNQNDVITVCVPRHVQLRFVNIPIDQNKKKSCQTFDKTGCSLYVFQHTLFVGIFLICWEVIKKCKFVFRERYVQGVFLGEKKKKIIM